MRDVIERLANVDSSAPSDYEQDGIRFCGFCHLPKQKRQSFPLQDGGKTERLVPIACRCTQEAEERARLEQGREQFRDRMKKLQSEYGITDLAYSKLNFSMDDRRDASISDTCLRYVERWESMRAENMGAIFYGTVGTGKSFYACCIANVLLDKLSPVVVTNFPRLLNLLQTAKNRQALIDHLNTYELLVIDDLGVERGSPFAAEQVFSVIDARARAKLPLIVTTNLTTDDLRSPVSMQYARIYDRVLEMCPIAIKMTGESRRVSGVERRKALARELLFPDASSTQSGEAAPEEPHEK